MQCKTYGVGTMREKGGRQSYNDHRIAASASVGSAELVGANVAFDDAA